MANNNRFLEKHQINEKLNSIYFHIHKIIEQINSNYKTKGLSNKEYMEVYTNLYDLCICKNAETNLKTLHTTYVNTFRNFLKEQTKIIISHNISGIHSATHILSLFQKKYEDFKVFRKWMVNIFRYLERYYIIQQNFSKLKIEANQIYFEEYEKILPIIVKNIILEVRKDRKGEIIDTKLLYNATKILIENKFYQEFEKLYMEESKNYYRECSQEWTSDMSQYLNNFSKLLRNEKRMTNAYLSISTYNKLLEEMFIIIIRIHLSEILEDTQYGFRTLLHYKKYHELQNMHSIITYFREGSIRIEEIYYNYITESISELVPSKENKLEYISQLIKKYQDFQEIASSLDTTNNYDTTPCYLKDKINKAFKVKISDISSFSQDLANCSDGYLKSGKKATQQEIEEVIKNIGQLFILMDDKDLFKEHYKELLAKRLLNNRHHDLEQEKSLIQNFKIISGHNFTIELEGIISDITLETKQLANYPYEFSTRVLSCGYWPTYITLNPNLPPSMAQYIEDYTEFHKKENNSLKLTYAHTVGTCEIKMFFQKKNYILSMTPIQAIIVLLFDQEKSYTYIEVLELSGLSKPVLNQVLGSLCFSKKKLLKKTPVSKKFKDEDILEFNSNFRSKLIKIKFPSINLKKTKKIKEKVSINRDNTIEATIVRIIKTKKIMEHSKLIPEVANQIRIFQPSIKHIKQRIEALIEREYLERTDKGYEYLA